MSVSITRIEIIGKDGREFSKCLTDSCYEISMRDGGKTIKLFEKDQAPINDDIWLDESTNLIWQVKVEDKRYLGGDIQQVAARLNANNYGGYNDWRIPNIDELKSLTINDKYKQIYKNTDLPDLASYYYWSSSEGASVTSNAWYVYFDYGYTNYHSKNNKYYVRCVRGRLS